MKKGVRPSPRLEAALLMANTARGRCRSQSSLRPLAKARSVSPMTPLARSTLALVFLWYAEPTNYLSCLNLPKINLLYPQIRSNISKYILIYLNLSLLNLPKNIFPILNLPKYI